MFSFKITKRSKRSRARLGILKTPHGEVETPAFVPVATRGALRTLDNEEAAELGSQLLIANTYHLHLAPGEKVIKKLGGLHKFMRWDRPIMTDSGGFQVFSLGFGRDHGVGKVLQEEREKSIKEDAQPVSVRISEEGVRFRSPIDGTELCLSPEESIRIQEDIGADIMFAFDECPSPLANEEYMRASVERTHRWAQRCVDAKRSKKQALYGIVQGGAYKELRIQSAQVIGNMDFEGFGIGGEFGYDKPSLARMVSAVTDHLPEHKPRHLLGIGHPEDFAYSMKSGADTFDCIAPTHYARRGIAFTSKGRVDLRKPSHRASAEPIDPACKCPVCKTYSRAFVSHLMRAHDNTGGKLATMHNVFFFNALAASLRKKIRSGDL